MFLLSKKFCMEYHLYIIHVSFISCSELVPASFLSERFMAQKIIMRHHGLGSHGAIPIAKALVVW